jgi:FkbM family methyltransferase
LIDVGAHSGAFSRGVDQLCGVSRGLLVEPQPERAGALRAQFAAPRFNIAQVAACDKLGEVEMDVYEFDATSSLLKVRGDLPQLAALDLRGKSCIKCRASTLDHLVDRELFPQVDLMKVDVQGAEHLVIRGAKETLKRTRLIWTEVSFKQLYENSCLFSDVYQLLDDSGFLLLEVEDAFRSPVGEIVQADVLFGRRD